MPPLRPLPLFQMLVIGNASDDGNPAVVVAVGPVRVMKVAVDQVVDMVPVWNALVAAVGRVNMSLGVIAAVVLGCAARGVHSADRQDVVVYMVAVDMMKMSVVQVVSMLAVPDLRVTTT